MFETIKSANAYNLGTVFTILLKPERYTLAYFMDKHGRIRKH